MTHSSSASASRYMRRLSILAALAAVVSTFLIAPQAASASSVTGVTVDNTAPTRAAGGRTNYVIDFTTSATGGLSAAANDRITVTFPTGTAFTGILTEDVFDGNGNDIGGCFSPNTTNLTIDCFLASHEFRRGLRHLRAGQGEGAARLRRRGSGLIFLRSDAMRRPASRLPRSACPAK